MSTITTDVLQSNTEQRTVTFPAFREFTATRKMVLHCYNCKTVTRRNPQSLKFCPVCGANVLINEPGKPHRKVKVTHETQTIPDRPETSEAAD
jgi:rRNA maturation endonuclease Nob1